MARVAKLRADLVAEELSEKRINNILAVLSKPVRNLDGHAESNSHRSTAPRGSHAAAEQLVPRGSHVAAELSPKTKEPAITAA